MSTDLGKPRRDVGKKVDELRTNLGLFSFRLDQASAVTNPEDVRFHQLTISSGIVEWLVTGEGSGAVTLAWQIMSQTGRNGIWAVVDPSRRFYFPALSAWGVSPDKLMVIRPATVQETCWSIEQCLRCPGVSTTWAWIDERVPERVHRRWQMAAEVGGGVGLFFRPLSAQRQPVWADLRLSVAPRSGGQGETRRLDVEVLYRRGGLGGSTQAWEIDHAAGLVRLVPEMANPAASARAV